MAAVATAQRPVLPPLGDRLLVCNRAEDTVSLLSPAERREVATLAVAPHPVEVAASPDGHTAAVASIGGDGTTATLTIVDVVGAHTRGAISLPAAPIGLRFEDPRRVLVFVRSGGAMRVDLVTSEIEAPFTPRGTVAPDQRPHTRERWLVDPESDTLTVLDPRRGPLATPLALGRGAGPVAFSPDGSLAFLACTNSGELMIFDTHRRALVAEVSMHGDRSEQSALPLAVACGADGRFAYVSCARGEFIAVVDLHRREYVDRIDARKGPCGIAYARPLRR